MPTRRRVTVRTRRSGRPNHVSTTTPISHDEALRAIYIDFEGRTNEPPVLLGVLYAEGRKIADQDRLVLRHDILDPVFEPLHGVVPVRCEQLLHRYDSDCRHPWIAIRDVVGRAEKQDRLIVAWSQHELQVVEKLCTAAGLSHTFSERFRDGKATARRWLRNTAPQLLPTRGGWGGAHKLAHYMDVVGWEVPEEFRPGRTGENLRVVRAALEKGRTWTAMTDRQRRGWWEVLGHNLHDCLGLRAVVLAATER